MRRSFITILIALSVTFSLPHMVHAEPVEEADILENNEKPEKPEERDVLKDLSSQAGEQEELEVFDEPEGTKDDSSNGYKFVNYDELGDFVTASSRSNYNCSQISFSCMIPEGFTHGVVLELKNETEDLKFRFVATSSNKYSCHMAVPAGDYRVLNCYVDKDTTLSYPMTMPKDFHLDRNQTLLVESTLKNYGEIEQEAERRLHPEVYQPEEDIKEEIPLETDREESVPPWRRVTHEGEGKGVITIIDNRNCCQIPISLIVEITATGGDKKGEYKYSTDNGITWSDVCVIRTDNEIPIITTDTLEDTRLRMRFESGEFLIYDRYSFNCDIEYAVTEEVSNGNGRIHISSAEPIFGDSYSISVKMTRTGGAGEGAFIYTLDGGKTWSTEMIVPVDGSFTIPGTQLLMTFWANGIKEDTFMVSDMYSCDIRGDMSKRSVAPYIICLLMIVVFMGFLVITGLRGQKSKPWEYTLNVYKPVEIKQKYRRR